MKSAFKANNVYQIFLILDYISEQICVHVF